MKTTFIQTGGTIDKDYPRKTKGYAFEIADPAVTRILQRANPNFEFEVLTVLRKDSLEITEGEREEICKACKEVSGDKIIITHGTDTMIETAERLSAIRAIFGNRVTWRCFCTSHLLSLCCVFCLSPVRLSRISSDNWRFHDFSFFT